MNPQRKHELVWLLRRRKDLFVCMYNDLANRGAALFLADTLYRECCESPNRITGRHMPMFILIGSAHPDCGGDRLGPLVGDILDRRGVTCGYMGTSARQIDASNLSYMLRLARSLAELHNRRPYVIAVDAATGMFGRVKVCRGALLPGEGNGINHLPPVGRVHLTIGMGMQMNDLLFARPSVVQEMAEVVAEALVRFDAALLQKEGDYHAAVPGS